MVSGRCSVTPKSAWCGGGSSRAGFTLFEVVLVMLILGVAAAAIVPAVGNNVRSPKLKTAANVLAADIEYCASECIAQPNAPRSISFDTSNNTYTLLDTNAGTALKHPMDSADFVNDFSSGRNAQLSGVSITKIAVGSSSTLSTLTFDAYGKPQITADLVITLAYNGQTMNVTVKMGTGDVSISG